MNSSVFQFLLLLIHMQGTSFSYWNVNRISNKCKRLISVLCTCLFAPLCNYVFLRGAHAFFQNVPFLVIFLASAIYTDMITSYFTYGAFFDWRFVSVALVCKGSVWARIKRWAAPCMEAQEKRKKREVERKEKSAKAEFILSDIVYDVRKWKEVRMVKKN